MEQERIVERPQQFDFQLHISHQLEVHDVSFFNYFDAAHAVLEDVPDEHHSSEPAGADRFVELEVRDAVADLGGRLR